jgi:hypothetical protein
MMTVVVLPDRDQLAPIEDCQIWQVPDHIVDEANEANVDLIRYVW